LARGAAAELNASGDEDQSDQDAQKINSKIHANNELKKEMDLDFEEISDGELEEESRIKGLGDALGVDWESLQKETQKPVKHEPEQFFDTTKSRWSAHRILWETGVSAKLGGEEFAREILTKARDKLRLEKQELRERMAKLKLEKSEEMKTEMTNGDVKKESTPVGGASEEVKIKDEPKDEENDNQVTKDETDTEESKSAEHERPTVGSVTEPEDDLPVEDFELDSDVMPHPCAAVQVVMRQLETKRRNLILHPKAKYGRALSARRDLKIRRILCDLPTKDIKINRNCSVEETPELRQFHDDIFKKLKGEVS
jgi:zinc finger CCCH domain-containing protein 13